MSQNGRPAERIRAELSPAAGEEREISDRGRSGARRQIGAIEWEQLAVSTASNGPRLHACEWQTIIDWAAKPTAPVCSSAQSGRRPRRAARSRPEAAAQCCCFALTFCGVATMSCWPDECKWRSPKMGLESSWRCSNSIPFEALFRRIWLVWGERRLAG